MARQVRCLGQHQAICASKLEADTSSAVELRQKAVEVAIAVTSGAYQTSLLTYLIQRDMFPSLMKVQLLPCNNHNHDGALSLTPR